MKIQTTVLIVPRWIFDVILSTDTFSKVYIVINFTKNTITCSINKTTH